jgi:D-alanyl-D-alanine carboxypeptidase
VADDHCLQTPRRIALIALIAGVALNPLMARASPSVTTTVHKSGTANQYLENLAREGKFSGVVLVQHNGKPVFEKAYGFAVSGWRIQNSLNTRFELASLSKQFTGAAILQLAESGKLKLDAPISQYYSKTPESWTGITVHQLANHTSGLPGDEIKDFAKGIGTPYSLDELIDTFRDRPLVSKPGEAWAYTNTEYYLLAYIIEQVSGEKYADYLTTHIFKPAGMVNSGFVSTLSIIPEAAEGYAREAGVLRHRDYFDRSLEVGAGGIYSTLGDMARWNQALDSGKLLGAESRKMMFTPSIPGDYGFGWFITQEPYLREFHEGSDPGFAAFEARYPTKGILILVLANLEDAPVREIEAHLAAQFVRD